MSEHGTIDEVIRHTLPSRFDFKCECGGNCKCTSVISPEGDVGAEAKCEACGKESVLETHVINV